MNYDVIATEIKTGAVRVIAENQTAANAEAIVKMSVMRRGVEDEFFSVRADGIPPPAREQSTICVRCRDGEKPCVRGNPRQCEWLQALAGRDP